METFSFEPVINVLSPFTGKFTFLDGDVQPFIPEQTLIFSNEGFGKLMNKGELVDAIAEKASVTKKEADAVLSATLDAIVEAVSGGDKVTLVGFGSFEGSVVAARSWGAAS